MSGLKQELGLAQGVGLLSTSLLGTGVFAVPALAALAAGNNSLWAWPALIVLVFPIAIVWVPQTSIILICGKLLLVFFISFIKSLVLFCINVIKQLQYFFGFVFIYDLDCKSCMNDDEVSGLNFGNK